MADYDQSKLANAGRNVAADYARWQKSSERMQKEIADALASGMSAYGVIAVLLGRCNDRAAMLNILATLSALVQLGRLDGEFDKIIAKGVLPKRV